MNDLSAPDATVSLLSALEAAPSIIASLVREVPAERRKARPRPGRWSAHEHACHLAEVEGLFEKRLALLLEEDDPRIVPFDPGPPGADDPLLSVDLEEALARYAAKRAANVRRLRSLPPAAWERTGRHPEYSRYGVRIMARHFSLHDGLHGYRIEEILLAR